MVFVSTKLLLEKRAKTKKNKNNENINNLWRIMGTKLVLLVYFWDPIFKTVFPIFLLLFSTLNSKMSRNMCKLCHKVRKVQNLPHKSPHFTNYSFCSHFTYNFSHFSTSLRQHYHNSFSKYFFFVFYSKLQDV